MKYLGICKIVNSETVDINSKKRYYQSLELLLKNLETKCQVIFVKLIFVI